MPRSIGERPFLNDPLRRLVRKGCAFDYAVKRGWIRAPQQDEALNYAEPARRHETRREAIERDYGEVIDRVLEAIEQRTVARDFDDVDLRTLAVDVIEAALRIEP